MDTHFRKAGIRLRWDVKPGPLYFVLWRIKHWGTQSALAAILSPDLFRSFIKDRFPTPKSSQFRPPHRNRIHFNAHTKAKGFAARIRKPSRLLCPDTKTHLILIQTPKPSNFRPLHKKQLYSDADTEINSSSIPHTDQVNFDRTKT